MTGGFEGKEPKLLDRLRETVRARHYSRSTEKAYVSCVKRFIFFHGKRHPKEMGEKEVTAFLNISQRKRASALRHKTRR